MTQVGKARWLKEALGLLITACVAALLSAGCSGFVGATSTDSPKPSSSVTPSDGSSPPTTRPSDSPALTPSMPLPTTTPLVSEAPLPTPTQSTAPVSTAPQISPCYFSPGQLSVKFAPQLSTQAGQDAFAAANGLREVSRVRGFPWIRYQITDGKSELDKAAELRASPLVADAIPILVCPVDY